MWYKTSTAKKLGIEYPILQGPFGGNLSTVRLTATVSNSGGLGGYGAYTLTPEEMSNVIRQIRLATNKPYNINLWVSDTDAGDGTIADDQLHRAQQLFKPYFDAVGAEIPGKPQPFRSRFENQLDVILHEKPPVFSFVFGVPSADVLEQCRKAGILTVGAATTLDEALLLDAAGVDMIIASGFEAGGHRPSFLASAESSTMGTFVLVQLIKEKVSVPVIAAGGIANGRGIAAAFKLGANAVQIGTAFLATEESNAPAAHREMLFSDAAKTTTLSRAFTGRLGRGMANRVTTDLAEAQKDFLPFPLQSHFTAHLRKAAIEKNRWDLIYLWSGQIAPLLKYRSAGKLMEALVAETTEYF